MQCLQFLLSLPRITLIANRMRKLFDRTPGIFTVYELHPDLMQIGTADIHIM